MKIIAESAFNHNGSFDELINLALESKKAGADYFTVQVMNVNQFCVNDYEKYQLYKDTEFSEAQWIELFDICKKNKIDFMTAPYDLDYVDQLNKFICAYKIGSGDITWKEIIEKISKKNKPVIIATGASNFDVVKAANKIGNNAFFTLR